MIKLGKISGETLAYGVAALSASAGLILFFIPAPHNSVAPSPDPRKVDETLAAEGNVEGESNVAIIQSLAKKFDLSDLPAPLAPEPPPPDPAAELKRYRFLGSAISGENVRALFEGNGAVYSINIGDQLAGFTLSRIEVRGAVFRRNEFAVELPLRVSQ